VRLADAIVRTGVLPAGIAAAIASAQGPGVPHAYELRLQLQSARADGRPTVSSAAVAAAPVADRHDSGEQRVRRGPVPTTATRGVPATPVRAVRAPATAVHVANAHQLQAAVAVVILGVTSGRPVHVWRRLLRHHERRHHQATVGRPAGDCGGGRRPYRQRTVTAVAAPPRTAGTVNGAIAAAARQAAKIVAKSVVVVVVVAGQWCQPSGR